MLIDIDSEFSSQVVLFCNFVGELREMIWKIY